MNTSTGPSDLPAASLYYREGSSDKEYHAQVQASGQGYIVGFAYGRRGSTLQSGVKTQHPTSLAEATAIWSKLVKEKEAKGYRREAKAESGKVATVTAQPAAPPPRRQSAVATEEPWLPQLLNPISEDALLLLIAEGHWGAQQKYDGKRIILVKRGERVQAFQRAGKACGIAPEIADYARTLLHDFIIDGEAIGPDYYAFDILEYCGADQRRSPYGTRHQTLLKLLGVPNGWPIHPSPLITGAAAIKKFIAELHAKNAEGIVLKDLLAPYTAGRPNSGGPQLKCKFYATCSAVVCAQNEQRSVGLALYLNDHQGLTIGNVTIPPNHAIPAVGQVVEIRYLYAYQGGALYQPVYLGARDDVDPADCTVEKQRLKFKAAAEEEAEA